MSSDVTPDPSALRVALVVSFLNEAEYLPRFLASLAAQTAPPEQVVLVDDGSTDASADLVEHFTRLHPWSSYHRRPPRPVEPDRLATAAELKAFQWGAERLQEPWDVVAKMDADLELNPELVQAVRRRFAADPQLGITGTYLCVIEPDGSRRRETHPPQHVRGPNKFFRRACFEQISPVPAVPGWEGIDELSARRQGWRTASFELESGDTLHLRPTGAKGGRLRAYRRWGRCAWAYGGSPLWVVLGGIYRARERPYGLGGLNYIVGWAHAGVRRLPRADPETRRFARREDMRELRRRLAGSRAGSRPGH
jgi:poly-beta-1,6-N-acetyl-D-glucosamine synthase